MKFRSLRLTAFRQHVDSLIQFPDGLIGVVGPNGAGKSSVVEAMSFALYGSRALRGKVDDVRTRGLPDPRRKPVLVSLSFEHDGATYRIERTLSDAALFSGGEAAPLCSGNRDVTTRIENLLSLNLEEFLSTFYTEQKGLEFLSGKRGASEREKAIVRMLGYDKLESIQELLRTDKRDLKNEVTGREAGLGSREELTAQIEQETKDTLVIRQKHDEAKRVLQGAEREVREMRKRFELIDARRREWLEKQSAVIKVQASLDERVRRIKWCEEERRGLRILLSEKGFSDFKLLEEAVAEKRQEVFACEASAILLQDTLRDREKSRTSALSVVQAELGVTKRALTEIKKHLSSYSNLDSHQPCPTCGQVLGDSFSHVVEEQERVLLDHEAKGKDYEREHERLLVVDDQERELVVQRTGMVEKIRSAEKSLQELCELRQRVESLSKLERELEALREEVEKCNHELKALRDSAGLLSFSEEEYLKAKGGFESSSRLEEVARLQRVRAEGELTTREALLARAQADLDGFDRKLLVLDGQKKKLISLEEADRILLEFRKYLNAAIRPRLAQLASEFLSELTDGRYTSVEILPDFTPTVLDEEGPKPVISGGEEDILNLCMRLALSHMLAERSGVMGAGGHTLSLLMLDEVFGSLDESRRANVLLLLEKLSYRFEQILVITHLEEIKDAVQNLVHVQFDESTGLSHIGAVEFETEPF